MAEPLSIVILTGAGISAESGVPTFRGPGGLWEGHRVEDVCTPEALADDPALVHRFYDLRRAALPSAEPNAAHRALARLDAEWPGDLLMWNASTLLTCAESAEIPLPYITIDDNHAMSIGSRVEQAPAGWKMIHRRASWRRKRNVGLHEQTHWRLLLPVYSAEFRGASSRP